MNNYGFCSKCNYPLSATFFEQEEYKTVQGIMIPTGRKKIACNYLYCEFCGTKETVDDTFYSEWYR